MATSTYSYVVFGEESLTIACVNELLERSHQIAGLVSDAAPVRSWALENDVPLVAREAICDLPPFDYLMSIANLRLLTDKELALPRKAAINFHDGPVLQIAGVNNPSWAILEGFKQHGVTWHEMVQEVDCGDVLVAEPIEIVKRPDDIFVAIDFNKLRLIRTCVTVADEVVSAGQHLQRCHPGQTNAGQIILMDAPHDLSGFGDFQDAVTITGADQSVAVLQAQD